MEGSFNIKLSRLIASIFVFSVLILDIRFNGNLSKLLMNELK